ncbi:MAG: hypothetical protein R6U98_20610 [Pirellulaceae bacterium]
MESRATQAVLPLVGLAADKVIRDRSIRITPERTPARVSGTTWKEPIEVSNSLIISGSRLTIGGTRHVV